jgi:uncharacterized membrane protein
MADSPELHPRSKRAWGVLFTVLVLEAFGGLALLVPVAAGMLAASSEPLGPRLSIFLALLIAWIWVCVTLFGALRTRASWSRGSAITIHVLLFAAGTGVLQLQMGDETLGWVLVLFALVGFFAALLARPRFDEFTHDDEAPVRRDPDDEVNSSR